MKELTQQKKMKRCVKGGIVERLNKLLLREKSDQAFWRHSLRSVCLIKN